LVIRLPLALTTVSAAGNLSEVRTPDGTSVYGHGPHQPVGSLSPLPRRASRQRGLVADPRGVPCSVARPALDARATERQYAGRPRSPGRHGRQRRRTTPRAVLGRIPPEEPPLDMRFTVVILARARQVVQQ